MKKTISKIMAAAMVLSTIPAVGLPTLTSTLDVQAATASTADRDEDTIVEDGSTGIKLTGGETTTFSDDKLSVAISGLGTVVLTSESGNASAEDFLDLVSLQFDSNKNLVVDVDTTTAANKKTLIDAVKAGNNGIVMTLNQDATNTGTLDVTPVALGELWPGGIYDAEKKAVVSGFEAEEGDLKVGNIYFNYDSIVDNAFTVEILKGDTVNVKLDDNDELRGQTLNLNTIKILGDKDGDISADVVKLGAQALKKAHMKKFKAENVKRVGKGALRQCKQLKHADLQDSNKIRKINSKAFYNCKNLKTIIIDGRKLNTVGKNAFAGVKKGCTVKIKAKKSKFNSDVKMIKKNGGNKNLKFVRK